MSDPAMEDMLYEIESVRRFVGLRLSDRLPDETTILNFRHLLEKHNLGSRILHRISVKLEKEGLVLREGTIVDASIVEAPSSTKNKKGERDPEMHQARKGKQWHFGMKMHIGVDDALGTVHSLEVSAANVSDIVAADKLLHGQECDVWGDAGYQGIDKRAEHAQRQVNWHIAMRLGLRKQLDPGSTAEAYEQTKASMRAKGEHPFRYVKQVFGYAKVRYRGLAKNRERIAMLCGFANLLITSRYRVV